MTRVLVSGATGKLGTPIVAAISAADDLTLAGRIARSLAAGEGFTSLADAIAGTQADVLIDVTAPEVGEAHALAEKSDLLLISGNFILLPFTVEFLW